MAETPIMPCRVWRRVRLKLCCVMRKRCNARKALVNQVWLAALARLVMVATDMRGPARERCAFNSDAGRHRTGGGGSCLVAQAGLSPAGGAHVGAGGGRLGQCRHLDLARCERQRAARAGSGLSIG